LGEGPGADGSSFLSGVNTILVGATRWVALSEPTGRTGVSPVRLIIHPLNLLNSGDIMLPEKIMEDAICNNPEKYLGEQGLKLISRQFRIGNYIFDLLFEDRHGAKLIVEVQKGTLDRDHTYRIIDYYHGYKEKNPQEFIELMVIANSIPKERKKRLSDWGVSFKEIPVSEFLEQSNIITQKSTEVHKNQTSQVMKLNPETIGNSTIFKERFKKALDKCEKDIHDLFRYLEKETDNFSAEKYTTNTPTYCIKKRYMFCEFTLLPNIRSDSDSIASRQY
jgi:hypothetical protein